MLPVAIVTSLIGLLWIEFLFQLTSIILKYISIYQLNTAISIKIYNGAGPHRPQTLLTTSWSQVQVQKLSCYGIQLAKPTD